MELLLATWSGRLALALLMAGICGVKPTSAAEDVASLNGSALSLWWVLPFAGLLLSVAAVPQLSPGFWHKHFGKVAAAWALLFLGPFAATYGIVLAASEVLHTALGEYLPFVILLFALFVISGGIRVRGNMVGTPAVNTGMLAFGAALASVTGTTGAAMLLVRPLDPGQPHGRRRAGRWSRPLAAGPAGFGSSNRSSPSPRFRRLIPGLSKRTAAPEPSPPL